MTSKDLKMISIERLDKKLLGSRWSIALITCLLFNLLMGVLSGTSFGIATIFIHGALNCGISFFFLKMIRSDDELNVGDLFCGFKENYTKNLLLGFLNLLFILLWSLLLVIPGLVKIYSYSMTYYISIDNPQLEPIDCITRSRELMDGNKKRLFYLHLSFIGWLLLSALTGGIVFLWVAPYIKGAEAAFYEDLIS